MSEFLKSYDVRTPRKTFHIGLDGVTNYPVSLQALPQANERRMMLRCSKLVRSIIIADTFRVPEGR